MFHTAESGVAELWNDLRAAKLFSGNDATLGSPGHLSREGQGHQPPTSKIRRYRLTESIRFSCPANVEDIPARRPGCQAATTTDASRKTAVMDHLSLYGGARNTRRVRCPLIEWNSGSAPWDR